MTSLSDRLATAEAIARRAGATALRYFEDTAALDITAKASLQDLVSDADIEVERQVRAELEAAFPDDGILGEEHGLKPARSEWTWVIDPIDGTANFVVGVPQWCVILACVSGEGTRVAVTYDPVADEMFTAAAGGGAHLNGKPIRVARAGGLDDGRVGLGMNGRTPSEDTARLLSALAAQGGRMFHNASGGLMLAYTAAGRLIGYAEPHMHPWDCLAGQLLVREAGGRCAPHRASDMLENGGRIIVAAPGIYDALLTLAETAYQR